MWDERREWDGNKMGDNHPPKKVIETEKDRNLEEENHQRN